MHLQEVLKSRSPSGQGGHRTGQGLRQKQCFLHPLVQPFEVENGSDTYHELLHNEDDGVQPSKPFSEGTLSITPISKR